MREIMMISGGAGRTDRSLIDHAVTVLPAPG
jgi:hypothetical protein